MSFNVKSDTNTTAESSNCRIWHHIFQYKSKTLAGFMAGKTLKGQLVQNIPHRIKDLLIFYHHIPHTSSTRYCLIGVSDVNYYLYWLVLIQWKRGIFIFRHSKYCHSVFQSWRCCLRCSSTVHSPNCSRIIPHCKRYLSLITFIPS